MLQQHSIYVLLQENFFRSMRSCDLSNGMRASCLVVNVLRGQGFVWAISEGRQSARIKVAKGGAQFFVLCRLQQFTESKSGLNFVNNQMLDFVAISR